MLSSNIFLSQVGARFSFRLGAVLPGPAPRYQLPSASTLGVIWRWQWSPDRKADTSNTLVGTTEPENIANDTSKLAVICIVEFEVSIG